MWVPHLLPYWLWGLGFAHLPSPRSLPQGDKTARAEWVQAHCINPITGPGTVVQAGQNIKQRRGPVSSDRPDHITCLYIIREKKHFKIHDILNLIKLLTLPWHLLQRTALKVICMQQLLFFIKFYEINDMHAWFSTIKTTLQPEKGYSTLFQVPWWKKLQCENFMYLFINRKKTLQRNRNYLRSFKRFLFSIFWMQILLKFLYHTT